MDRPASPKVRASLAGTTGVQTATDVVKYLLAGADVVMTTSALLRHRWRVSQYATVLLDGLAEWMIRKGFSSVDQMRGLLAVPAGTDQSAHQRGGYVIAMQLANRGLYDP
jgi:dihydroorotate dehydrogenase (fumarate)